MNIETKEAKLFLGKEKICFTIKSENYKGARKDEIIFDSVKVFETMIIFYGSCGERGCLCLLPDGIQYSNSETLFTAIIQAGKKEFDIIKRNFIEKERELYVLKKAKRILEKNKINYVYFYCEETKEHFIEIEKKFFESESGIEFYKKMMRFLKNECIDNIIICGVLGVDYACSSRQN